MVLLLFSHIRTGEADMVACWLEQFFQDYKVVGFISPLLWCSWIKFSVIMFS